MGLIFLIVAGSVSGWLFSFITKIDSWRETQINMLAGIVGAMIAGLIISPKLGSGSMFGGNYSIGALLISLIGAALAVILVELARKKELL